MALPVLEGIASVFGAAVPAYQQARNFVLKSQEAALDYRIAVANLITRLRTEELANAARMRSAAADAISNVRRTFELDGPVYQAVVAELINSNVPDQQQKNFLDSVRNQRYLTEDDVEYVFALTKGDRPEDAGTGGGGGGVDDFLKQLKFFEYEADLKAGDIDDNQRALLDLTGIRRDRSRFDNMSPDEQREIDSNIITLTNQGTNLRNDLNAALRSRDYLAQNPYATIGEIRELFPPSWYQRQGAGSAGTGTPVVTPPPPIDTNPDFELEWDGSSPPASVFNQDRERAIRDSIMVDQAIPGLAPPIKAKQ